MSVDESRMREAWADPKVANIVYHDWEASTYDEKWSISYDERCISYARDRYVHIAGDGGWPAQRMLEIGAGTGFFTLNLMQAGLAQSAVVTDISQGMVDVAVRNGRTLGLDVTGQAADAEALPFADGEFDLVIGHAVLHHIPDTQAAMQRCVDALKPGAPFLVYLYYRFDNRPAWFRRLWEASDRARQVISALPTERRHLVTNVIAGTVYLPLAKTASALEKLGLDVSAFPLSAYRHRSFYTMRTDALDRFGFATRQFIEFASSQPQWGWVIIRAGSFLPQMHRQMETHMCADLKRGRAQGQITTEIDAFLVDTIVAMVIAALAARLRGDAGPEAGSRVTELVLNMLEVPPQRAHAVAWQDITLKDLQLPVRPKTIRVPRQT